MRAIGIDLGTTNSASATGGKDGKVLPTRDGEQLTPSVVSLVKRRNSPDAETVVGRQAVNNAARDPENTIFSIKRLMGLQYGEKRVGKGFGGKNIDDVLSHSSYRLADAPDKDAEDQGVRVMLGEESYTPVEVSAMILKQIKSDAEQAIGESVTHAVITVPAYFEERQRKATAEAGVAAGLNVLRVIDEPSAAAQAYGAGKEDEQHRVLVYDLGGGTFDISIIQMVDGQYQTLEIQGDNWLGGDDFDRVIVKRMIDWVKETYDGHDASEDMGFIAKAKEEAQRAKKALSTQQSADIFAPLLKLPGEGVVDVDMSINREDFEKAIEPFVDKTIELVEKALENQHFTPDDITEVLLVGGSTAVPLVQKRVAEVFGKEKIKRDVNPMECVAVGAANLAEEFELSPDGEIDSTKADEKHIEITAMHLGIAAVKGQNPDAFVPIIPKGTPYPLSKPKKQIFYPTAEDQKVIRVPIYEGLNELASLNEQQGVLEFPLAEGLDTNTAVEIAFNYDQHRVTTVGVKIIGGTGEEFKETLKRGRPRVAQDEEETLLDDWRDELQPRIRAAQHFIESYGDYMEPGDQQEMREAIVEGEKALEENEETAGERWMMTLDNKIMTSGTASQLFMAERSMQGAPESTARELGEAVAALREAHLAGRTQDVDNLSQVLRMRVAQVMSQRSQIKGLEDRTDLQDLLRVRE